jgi:hypothetical protein
MELSLGHNAGEINARRDPEPANRPNTGQGVKVEARARELEPSSSGSAATGR